MFKRDNRAMASIHRLIDARMAESGKAAVAEATRLVPVKTGQLKASIGFNYDRSSRTLTIHADMPYAAAVEFGTIRTRAHPYLRPALNAIGRMWGGGTQLDFPHAFGRSGKPARPEVARHNAKVARKLGKGASRRAKVVYRRGR